MNESSSQKNDSGSKQPRFLFLCSERSLFWGLFSDLENRNDVDICVIKERRFSFPINIVQRCFLWSRVNRFFEMPFKYLWYKFTIPNRLYSNIIVLVDHALCGWIPYLRKAKKEGKRVDAYLFDSIDAYGREVISSKRALLTKKIEFDNVYTFDQGDALKYGLCYAGICHYSLSYFPVVPITRDLYFIGSLADGRESLLKGVYDYLSNYNVKLEFDVSYGRIRGEGINNLPDWISYEEAVSRSCGSRCILEIVREGQHAPSLRYLEAICYNRKLLTNNQYVVDYPYYDPKYIKIFKAPQDIDVNWILEDTDIDYKYDGLFSPNTLIEYIKNNTKE